MKKILLTAGMLMFGMVGSASAYNFTDTIEYWNVSGTSYGATKTSAHVLDSVLITENNTLNYVHDINDSVDFAAGHMVTSASLQLDFTNDLLDVEFTHWYDKWMANTTEHIYYGFDGSAWTYLGEVDNGQYNIGIDLALLNIDGKLAVSLAVSNWDNGNTSAWLDHSTLSGTAVPEPATMLLMGLGLAGLVAYNRKRSNKKA